MAEKFWQIIVVGRKKLAKVSQFKCYKQLTDQASSGKFIVRTFPAKVFLAKVVLYTIIQVHNIFFNAVNFYC